MRRFTKNFYRLDLAATAALMLGGFAATASAQSTIAQLANGGTVGDPYTLNPVEVVGIVDNNSAATFTSPILEDSTGSLIDFQLPKATYVPQLGDILNITANDSPFDGAPEIKNAPISLSVVSSGNAVPTPPVLTIPQVKAAVVEPYVDAIVTLNHVTIASNPSFPLAGNASYTLTDGTNTITMFTYKSYTGSVAGTAALNLVSSSTVPLNITGFVDDFNGTAELYPLSVVALPEPTSLSLLAVGGIMLTRRRRRA
jgi:hypothetical protein